MVGVKDLYKTSFGWITKGQYEFLQGIRRYAEYIKIQYPCRPSIDSLVDIAYNTNRVNGAFTFSKKKSVDVTPKAEHVADKIRFYCKALNIGLRHIPEDYREACLVVYLTDAEADDPKINELCLHAMNRYICQPY